MDVPTRIPDKESGKVRKRAALSQDFIEGIVYYPKKLNKCKIEN